MATRGPSGSGHRPRARSSGGDILQAEAERFEDVTLFDLIRPVEVGGGSRDAPGPVKTARRHAPLRRPALEGAARDGRKSGELTESRRLELRVEAALPVKLAKPRRDDTAPDGGRRLTAGLGRQGLQGDAAHADLKVDAVEERPRQPARVAVDSRGGAAASA